jgi:anion-transporting  ArsA/GET3 family ATPase
VLLTGKVKEATTRTDERGRRVYHEVVLDAPPTGRIGRFLNVTAEAAKLAKMGPIKTQSEGVAALLRSPMTSVHLVTLLEEMPVQETVDAVAELKGLGIAVGKVIVNRAHPALLSGVRRVTQADLRRGLTASGLAADKQTVVGLQEQATAYLARHTIERELSEELAGLGRPMVELPMLPGGVDRTDLTMLADLLRTTP